MGTRLAGLIRRSAAVLVVAAACALLPAVPADASSTNIVNAETSIDGWKVYTTQRTSHTAVTFDPIDSYGGLLFQNSEDGYALGLQTTCPGCSVSDDIFAVVWWGTSERQTLIESGDGSNFTFVLAAWRYNWTNDHYWGGNLTW